MMRGVGWVNVVGGGMYEVGRVIVLSYYLTITKYGRTPRMRVRDKCRIVAMSPSSQMLSDACSTAVHNQRSVRVCPRIDNALAGMYIARNRQMGGKRTLFVVSRIPCRTTLRATLTGIRTTGTALTATRLACSDGRRLCERGMISRFSLDATGGSLLTTGTRLTRIGTRRIGTHGGLSCAMIGDPTSKIIKALPCHMKTLIDTDLPRTLAAISSGSSVCICFSVARGRLLKLVERCNSGRRTLGRVPTVSLLLGSGSTCSRGKEVRAVDKIVSHDAKAIDLHTMFPGRKKLLRDNNTNGIVMPIRGTNTVIVPRTTACRVRSGMFMCGMMSNGTRSTPIRIAHIGNKGRCVMSDKLRSNRIVITRKIKLLHRNAPVRPGSTLRNASGWLVGWERGGRLGGFR